jgi:hypothetical protein
MSDIARLFAEDPLNLTTTDLDELITHYRQARAQFNLGVKPAPRAKAKTEKVDSINLEELDL